MVSTTLGVAAKLWPGALLRWHAGGVLWFRPRAFLRCSACSGWPGVATSCTPGSSAASGTPSFAVWMVLALGCVVVALRRPVDVLPLLTSLVVGLLVLSRIFSFQYLLWTVLFFAMVWARRDRLLPAIYAGCCLVTLAVFSQWWFVLIDERAGAVRLWVVLAITLPNLYSWA